jgi:hypothetical protein
MTYFGMGDVAAARDQYLQGYKIAKHLIEKFPDVREHKSLMSDLLFNLAQSKTEGFSWKMSADYFDGLIKEGIATPSTVANAKLTREYAKQEKEKASAP